MSEPDQPSRVQKGTTQEADASEGSNGTKGKNGHAPKAEAPTEVKSDVKIEATRDSAREKSVEDALEAFITRANTQAVEEFDGWGVSTDRDAERAQGTPAPEVIGKPADQKKRKSPNGTPRNGSAIAQHAEVAARAADIALKKAPPEPLEVDLDDEAPARPTASDKTEVVSKLPLPATAAGAAEPPIVVKRGFGWPALIVALAIGGVAVFFIVRFTMKKNDKGATDQATPAVNAQPVSPVEPAAAPGTAPAPAASLAPAPAPIEPAVASPEPAPPAVEPSPVAPAPVVEPLAAPAAAPAASTAPVAPAAAPPVVTPLPVETKPTSKPTSKPVAKPTSKPAKGGIADPFATGDKKPASKPTKSTPKKSTPKKAGGIVDPFAN